ncbi:trypsin-like peptidase domain-containing protein [Clostridium sp. D33t1_170424_F3]|uniref:S1C family serine protease n=1 Tax=Clostridium sp. D33t1_170424_F3 TaxID=2787099 RepID=UPI0025707FBE|nr:trypsin-like peptidase domain-containing protein [Clostridium sp. D33t1_170424_F3]
MYNPNEMNHTPNEGFDNSLEHDTAESMNVSAQDSTINSEPVENSEYHWSAAESHSEPAAEAVAPEEPHTEPVMNAWQPDNAGQYAQSQPEQGNYSYYGSNGPANGQQYPYGAYSNLHGGSQQYTYGGSYQQPQQPNSYSGHQNQVMWQGDYYHSYQNPQPSYAAQPKPKKEKKPMGKGKKTALKVIAGVMACLMISVGSIGGFMALINNGYISVNNSGSPTDPAFTINKLVDNNQPTATINGQLTLQQIAEKVVPSVVCIQNYQKSTNSYEYFFNGGRQQEEAGDEVSPVGEGSGVIATSDGYIITNAHVVDGATSLKVITSDGKSYEAKLIGSDSITDLAVIKIEATGLTAAEFGSSGDLKVADTVMAIGNPGGLELSSSVTVGYVSALNRQITNSENGYTMDCIQTDAAINPGNSGGALVNMYGQVVGINSSKIVATGYEGLGFAIPIDDAQPVISNLKDYGYVKDRAVLGISGQYLDSMSARFYGLTPGMYVASVNNQSVVDAGITQGCIITKIDDKAISNSSTITSYVSKKKPGEKVTLTVVNDLTGKTFTADVTLVQASGQ